MNDNSVTFDPERFGPSVKSGSSVLDVIVIQIKQTAL